MYNFVTFSSKFAFSFLKLPIIDIVKLHFFLRPLDGLLFSRVGFLFQILLEIQEVGFFSR